jgi:hypothetical protein
MPSSFQSGPARMRAPGAMVQLPPASGYPSTAASSSRNSKSAGKLALRRIMQTEITNTPPSKAVLRALTIAISSWSAVGARWICSPCA